MTADSKLPDFRSRTCDSVPEITQPLGGGAGTQGVLGSWHPRACASQVPPPPRHDELVIHLLTGAEKQVPLGPLISPDGRSGAGCHPEPPPRPWPPAGNGLDGSPVVWGTRLTWRCDALSRAPWMLAGARRVRRGADVPLSWQEFCGVGSAHRLWSLALRRGGARCWWRRMPALPCPTAGTLSCRAEGHSSLQGDPVLGSPVPQLWLS